MPAESDRRVANPPPRPLMIWDGDCAFCGRWIERWKGQTKEAIDYHTLQSVAERFPEIPAEQFQRAVILITPDGAVFAGAEAVYRSLALGSSKKWLLWSYEHIPAFATVSDIAYKIVARNRRFASVVFKK